MDTKLELSQTKLKWWPSPQDYSEAVQAPVSSFIDEELRHGSIFVDAMGLPKPVCGAFASVYRMRSGASDYAVRCFLRNTADQERRYGLVTEFVQADDLPYTVAFDFQREGIKVNSDWFPLLKMDWVTGLTLDYYLAVNFRDSSLMSELARKFLTMSQSLRSNGIAHGDLQHGNVIVSEGELRLVDYDGMFVPGMSGLLASELGHRNYQHPNRSENHFGAYLDNFSDWVIYASIKALALDPSLFSKFHFGDDSLLFKREDFLAPEESLVFRTLENHQEREIRSLVRFIRAQLRVDPSDVPALLGSAPEVVLAKLELPELVVVEYPPADTVLALPDWLQPGALLAEEEQRQNQLPDWMREDAGRFVAPIVVPKTEADVVEVGEYNPDHLELGVFEPELYRKRPRAVVAPENGNPVSLHFFGTAACLCFALFTPITTFCLWAMVILNAFIAVAFWGWPAHARLVRDGRVAKAVILPATEHSSGYWITIEFETHKKEKIRSMVRLTPAEYPLFINRTQPITVLYNESNPTDNILYERSVFSSGDL